MVSKCANPECEATFRYLREGKLFTVPVSRGQAESVSSAARARCVEYAWLCPSCSSRLTLCLTSEGELAVVTKVGERTSGLPEISLR